MIFSSAGFQVYIYEADEASRSQVLGRITTKLSTSAQHGVLEVQPERTSFSEGHDHHHGHHHPHSSEHTPEKQQEQVQSCLKRITLVTSLSELLSHCFYIQECIPERLELKQALFKQIEETAHSIGKHQIIIGSSTSTLAVSSLVAHCSSFNAAKEANHNVDDETNFSRQCVVVHPINPPELIPAVEVIPASFTNQSTLRTIQRLLLASKKKPILVKKEVDGFVVNRLQYALLSEAYRLVHDGVASPEDVDSAICDGLGLRWAFMGPFKTIHLNAPDGVTDYCDRYIGAVERITRTQDNSIHWDPATIQTIHHSMQHQIPSDQRTQAYQWRDQNLLEIIKCKQQSSE